MCVFKNYIVFKKLNTIYIIASSLTSQEEKGEEKNLQIPSAKATFFSTFYKKMLQLFNL